MKSPSKILFSVESIRGAYELGLGWLLSTPLKLICNSGDNHPVVVIPGLGTNDDSTYYIRNFLDGIGYKSHPWGLGRNLGPRRGLDSLISQLHSYVKDISESSDNQKVSIIGWSLGGIYARELAKFSPTYIRQVITLGTPFKGNSGSTNAEFLYELLSKDKDHKNPDIINRLSIPPQVHFTSLYSKSDGVVSWKAALEDESSIHENIEIPYASHLGLGHNPISMFIIANRLSQKEDTWMRYKELK
jgi:pimeloyl-ACP methyl ester carboxylesterase